jgi:hypothetical protein
MSIKHAILAAALCTTVVSNANAAVLFSDNFDSETLGLN